MKVILNASGAPTLIIQTADLKNKNEPWIKFGLPQSSAAVLNRSQSFPHNKWNDTVQLICFSNSFPSLFIPLGINW